MGANGRVDADPYDRDDPQDPELLAGVEHALGYTFRDKALLKEALSHRSWASEAEHIGGRPHPSNERLEFLGDAVLQMVATDYMFRKYRNLREGELAKARASVVSSASLAEVATHLGLGRYVLLGRGERASGGREKPSILSDAVEALIGAVYLDGGWEAASAVVMSIFKERLDEAALGPGAGDYKTRLQELALASGRGLPEYRVSEEGPDHAKRFFAEVLIGGEPLGSGEGRSKKQAEQSAAKEALKGIVEDSTALGSKSAPPVDWDTCQNGSATDRSASGDPEVAGSVSVRPLEVDDSEGTSGGSPNLGESGGRGARAS